MFGEPNKWAVIGLYVGDRQTGGILVQEREMDGRVITDSRGNVRSERNVGGTLVGLVSRAADFGTWEPKLLGHSLIAEANPSPDEAEAEGPSRSV